MVQKVPTTETLYNAVDKLFTNKLLTHGYIRAIKNLTVRHLIDRYANYMYVCKNTLDLYYVPHFHVPFLPHFSGGNSCV